MIEILESIKEILNTPVVIGGVSTLSIGAIAIFVLKTLMGIKKPELLAVKKDISGVKSEIENKVNTDKYNEMVEYCAKSQELLVEMAKTIKNENTKSEMVDKINALSIPSAIQEQVKVVVESKKKEKKIKF